MRVKEDIDSKSTNQNRLSEKGTTNPTLSLCMIVKNEEKFLPGCLESVKDHVDEMIIVDTGSTDNTVVIAKKYGAKVYVHLWENNFSKTRNYSLKYATCDWILWLDADEEVDRNDAYKLREVIKGPVEGDAISANVIAMPMFDRQNGGKDLTVVNTEKLFKNHLGFHFEGIVHNALKSSGQTKTVNIRIYHYGYSQGEEQMEKKFFRTSKLLKKQIENNPEDPMPHHYLAISYLDRKKHDECISEAIEAIRLFELHEPEVQAKLITYYTASVAFYRKEDLHKAESYALKALDFYPDYLDASCMLSSIYFRLKEHDKCVKAAKKYLSLLGSITTDPSTALFIPFCTLQHAWFAHVRIAIINFIQGKDNEGLHALKNAVNCVDNKWEPSFSVGKYFFEQREFEKAKRFLMDGLNIDPSNQSILPYILETHLAIGKMQISQSDIEGCITSCDELLKILNLPRYLTINSMSDLSNLYTNIGTSLLGQEKERLANLSFEIATTLGPKLQSKV